MILTQKQEEGLKIALSRFQNKEKYTLYCGICRFENSFGRNLRN